MNLSLGLPSPSPQGTQTPAQGTEPKGTGSNGTATSTTSTSATQTVTPKLPAMNQPPKDQMVASTAEPKQFQVNYNASAQTPLLPKPAENTQETAHPAKNGHTKEAPVHAGQQTQQTDFSDQSQTAPSEKPHKDQDGQEGGQSGSGGGGGGEGSGSGSGSNNSASSGGGDQRGQGKPNLEPSSANASVSLNATAATGSTSLNVSSGASTDLAGDTQNTTGPVNPLDSPTTISALGSYSPPVNPAQFFSNAGTMMNEIYQFGVQLAATLPPGPAKFQYQNFLLLVQAALSDYQQVLHANEGGDAEAARSRTSAQLESTLSKLQKQNEQQDKIDQQKIAAAAKEKILGPLGKLGDFIMMIICAIALVFTPIILIAGPPGMFAVSMIACEMVDCGAKLAGKQPFAVQALMTALTELITGAVDKIATNEGLDAEQTKSAVLLARTIVLSFMMAMSVAVCPMSFICGGFQALTDALTDSGIITDNLEANGMSTDQAQMTQSYITMAIGMAFVIATLGLAMIIPPDAAGEIAEAFSSITEASAEIAESVARMMAGTLKFFTNMGDTAAAQVVKFMEALFRTLMDPEIWLSSAQLAVQTTQAVGTYNLQKTLAFISTIQAQLKQSLTLSDATISILQNMITELLSGLSELSDQIQTSAQMLKQTDANVSNITANLFG